MGARAPAGRRPGPRTPRRRRAASAPTAAALTDSGQAWPSGAPGGTRRPPPPQLGHPPGPPSPGPAREPWLPAEPPCAPFPSGDLGARKTGQGREGEEGRHGEETPSQRDKSKGRAETHTTEIQKKRGQTGLGRDRRGRGEKLGEGKRPIEKGQRRGRQIHREGDRDRERERNSERGEVRDAERDRDRDPVRDRHRRGTEVQTEVGGGLDRREKRRLCDSSVTYPPLRTVPRPPCPHTL